MAFVVVALDLLPCEPLSIQLFFDLDLTEMELNIALRQSNASGGETNHIQGPIHSDNETQERPNTPGFQVDQGNSMLLFPVIARERELGWSAGKQTKQQAMKQARAMSDGALLMA